MTMVLLALLGGVLTILSPCILPVIPLVFARTGGNFRREIAPMLAGLALAFNNEAVIQNQSAVIASEQFAKSGFFASAKFFAVRANDRLEKTALARQFDQLCKSMWPFVRHC